MDEWELPQFDCIDPSKEILSELPKFTSHAYTDDNDDAMDSASLPLDGNIFDPTPHTLDISPLPEIPSSLSDTDIPNWLKDEPSWLKDATQLGKLGSAGQEMVGLVDTQEVSSISYINYPNMIDDLPCDARAPPDNQLSIQKISAQASGAHHHHHHHHQLAQAMAAPACVDQSANGIHVYKNNELADCQKPHSVCSRPASNSWADVSNVAVVKELQFSRRLEGKGGNLSLEDTRICLKVSKLHGPSQNSENNTRDVYGNGDLKVDEARTSYQFA